jgi:multidrug efflux system membrane fusion protein
MNKISLASRTTWAVAAAAVLLVGAAIWSIHRDAHAQDRKDARRGAEGPVAVTTAPVKQQDVAIYRTGIGTVTAAQSVTVKVRIDGQLDQVNFIEGQDVKAGQVLARIDPRTYEAQLAQAQAQRAKDEAQLANARTDLQRYATLITQEAATQQQLDTQKALVAQLEAAVRTDEAAVKLAQVQLSYTTIAAPIGGRTGARLVDAGNIVHATDPNGLVVINQIDPISTVFTLPEDAVQQINDEMNRSHQPMEVHAYARESDKLLATGKLVLLNNQIDTTSGTVQLKAAFPNPQHRLWPGQYVNVRLVLGTRRQALTVPAAAVQRGPDGLYAYVVDADGKTVQAKPLTVSQTQDGIAVIDSGVGAGQRVVVDGQYKLKPGAHIVEAQRPGSAPGTASVAQAGGATN